MQITVQSIYTEKGLAICEKESDQAGGLTVAQAPNTANAARQPKIPPNHAY
jgi:hypothetical protein